MKVKLLLFFFMAAIQLAHSQLKTTKVCPAFMVDVLEGKINNDLSTRSTLGEFKTTLPCYTEIIEENTGTKCAGVFYKDKDIKFYSDRDYLEIGANFKGKLSLPLLGANRKNLFKWLGYPKIKDVNWDAFTTKYGIMILYYTKAGKVNKIQMSHKTTDSIKLCE